MRAAASLVAVAADVLEMERIDLVRELLAGKSIAEVAEAAGVDPQDIIDAFVAQRAEWLQALVDAGRITQEQADERLAEMAEHVAERINQAFEPGSGNRRGGMGGGCLQP